MHSEIIGFDDLIRISGSSKHLRRQRIRIQGDRSNEPVKIAVGKLRVIFLQSPSRCRQNFLWNVCQVMACCAANRPKGQEHSTGKSGGEGSNGQVQETGAETADAGGARSLPQYGQNLSVSETSRWQCAQAG